MPEEVNLWEDDEIMLRNAYGGIQTRIVTYIPTGRQVYDNSLHPAKAVVFEYELDVYTKSMVKL